MASETSYFVRWRGKISGPVGGGRLRQQLKSGEVSKHHQVSIDRQHWISICEHEDFASDCAPGTAKTSTAASHDDAGDDTSSEHGRLKLQGEGASCGAPGDGNWYYVEDGNVAGPVGLEELQGLIFSGYLPKDVPLCKEGEEVWQHASLVLGSLQAESSASDAPAQASVAEPESSSATSGSERVCLNCGRIHRGSGSFCEHCGKKLGPTKKNYGGIGRLAYVGCLVALGLIQALLSAATPTVEGYSALAFVFAVLQFVPVVFRLKNIGMTGWWAILMLVPLANLVIGGYCLACPEGYQDSKELDTAGRVIVAVIVGLLVLAVLVLLAVLAATL